MIFSGFLNVVTRPLGGYLGDLAYRHYGTKGKKLWTLSSGIVMGAALLAGGFYLQEHQPSHDAKCAYYVFSPSDSKRVLWRPLRKTVSVLMGVFSVAAIFSELGNGANFSLVPHCNPYNNVSCCSRQKETRS